MDGIKKIYKVSNLLLMVVALFVVSCETKKKAGTDLTPRVELVGRWNNNSAAPTNSRSEFKVYLKVDNTSVQIIKDQSFCLDDSNNKVSIVDDVLAQRVLHNGTSPIDLQLPTTFTTGYSGSLTNCQVAWKYLQDPDTKISIILLGGFYFDKTPSTLTISAPNTALSPAQILDAGNNYVKLLANKNLTIVNSSESCLDLQKSGISSLTKGQYSGKIPISVGNLKPDTNTGFGVGKKICTVKAVDPAGNSVDATFALAVRKAVFSAKLNKSPPYEYVYTAGANGGRAELTANPESAGVVTCSTSQGISCLTSPWQVNAGSQAKTFNSMYVGLDDYVVTFTPNGFIANTGWDTVVTFPSVKYDAGVTFNVVLAQPAPTGTRSVGYAYHNPVALKATSNIAGKITFAPSRPGQVCPPYPETILPANTTVDIPNQIGGVYIGRYPTGTTNPNDATVPNFNVNCTATLTISSPADLNGSTAVSPFGYQIDRQPPRLDFVTDPIEVPIDKAAGFGVGIITEENVLVTANSCKDRNVGATVFTGTSSLNTDLSDIKTTSCTMTFIDGVIDATPQHTVTKTFNFSIVPALFEFRGPNSFNGLAGSGIFKSSANGIVLCRGPIDGTPGEVNGDCFRGPKGILSSTTAQETSNLLLQDLVSGTHDYEFTLIPDPPYKYLVPADKDLATYKTVITAKITARDDPLSFRFDNLNNRTRFGKNIPWVEIGFYSTIAGKATATPIAGKACPLPSSFDVPAGTSTTTVNILDETKFPANQETQIGCDITLTTNETPQQRKATLTLDSKVVDNKSPSLTTSPAGRAQPIPVDAAISTNYGMLFFSNESSSLTSSSGCVANTGASSLKANVSSTIALNIPQTSESPIESKDGNSTTYTCKFIATDAAGNTSPELAVTYLVSRPTFKISAVSSPFVDSTSFTTTVSNITIYVQAGSDGVVECVYNTTSVGKATVRSSSPSTPLNLTGIKPGSYSYDCTFTPDGAGSFATTKSITIQFLSDTTLVLNNVPSDPTADTNFKINVTSSRDGLIALTPLAGGLCPDIRNSATTIQVSANRPIDLPISNSTKCTGTICNYNCTLTLTESETGNSFQASQVVKFNLNTSGISLDNPPFTPNAEGIVDYKTTTYKVSFSEAIALNGSASAITFNRYDTGGVLFSISDSNLSVSGSTLTITVPTANNATLLDISRFYIDIPAGKIVSPKSSLTQYNGTGNSKPWNYYTSISFSEVKPYLRTANVGSSAVQKMDVNCYNSNSNRRYCISANPAPVTAQIAGYLGNFPMKYETNIGTIIDTMAAGSDSNGTAVITITAKRPYDDLPGQQQTVNSYYKYVPGASEKFDTNVANRLYTLNNVIITSTDTERGKLDPNINYTYSGLAKKVSDPNRPLLGAWSLRQLNSNAKLAIKVIALNSTYNYSYQASSNDGNSTDIGFTKDGSLDVATLKTFVDNNKASIISVMQWYDQSLNNRDLKQASVNANGYSYSHLPIIAFKGDIVRGANGLPGILFPTSNFANSISDLASLINRNYTKAMLSTGSYFTLDSLRTSINNTNYNFYPATMFYVGTAANSYNSADYLAGFSSKSDQNNYWIWLLNGNRGSNIGFAVGNGNRTDLSYTPYANYSFVSNTISQFSMTFSTVANFYMKGSALTCSGSNGQPSGCSTLSYDNKRVPNSSNLYFNVGGGGTSSAIGTGDMYIDSFGSADNYNSKLIMQELLIYKDTLSAGDQTIINQDQINAYGIK